MFWFFRVTSLILLSGNEAASEYLLTVTPNGSVSWDFPSIAESSCDLNVLYYPWDYQRCELHFTSWIQPSHTLFLKHSGHNGTTAFFTDHGEWHVLGFPAEEKIDSYKGQLYYEIVFTVKLQRKPLFIFFNILLPSIWLTFCTYLVFLLPPECGEKVVLAVTMLLATTVFLLIVSQHLPPKSTAVPIIGTYFVAWSINSSNRHI